jgi:hypothetical protein
VFLHNLIQITQITNGDPNTHIQRGKRINEKMSFQPESFTVPNQVVHCLIISCTHTLIRSSTIRNLPRCDRAKQCPDKTLDTVQTNLLSSFWPSNQGRCVTSGKIEWAKMPVWPHSGNRLETMVGRIWRLPMPSVVPAHRPVHFPSVPRETKSTSTSPQFRSGTGSSTIVYIHTPEGDFDARFF